MSPAWSTGIHSIAIARHQHSLRINPFGMRLVPSRDQSDRIRGFVSEQKALQILERYFQ
jgi:hypothetical protein